MLSRDCLNKGLKYEILFDIRLKRDGLVEIAFVTFLDVTNKLYFRRPLHEVNILDWEFDF